MKRLICAKDVEAAENQGKKVMYVDSNTIITPSAKDVAKACGIGFSREASVCLQQATWEEKVTEVGKVLEPAKVCQDGLDSEMIYKLLKTMMDKGLLNGILDSITNTNPYVAESIGNGLKVIRGNSIKYDVFDTGNPNAKVSYQEIISKNESSMSAGLLTIDHSEFDREITYEEINYVIEGKLTVKIDGKSLIAYPGDVVYIPSGSKVTRSSCDKAKIFYVIYPAN